MLFSLVKKFIGIYKHGWYQSLKVKHSNIPTKSIVQVFWWILFRWAAGRQCFGSFSSLSQSTREALEKKLSHNLAEKHCKILQSTKSWPNLQPIQIHLLSSFTRLLEYYFTDRISWNYSTGTAKTENSLDLISVEIEIECNASLIFCQ